MGSIFSAKKVEEVIEGAEGSRWRRPPAVAINNDLNDIVFSWSMEDILNEDLYKNQAISTLPYARVTGFEECKPYGKNFYEVNVDFWINRSSKRGKEPYKMLPRDVLILTDSVPEIVSDLQRMGRICAFASVTKISDDESEGDVYFKVVTGKTMGDINWKQRELFAISLGVNLTTNIRIWTALHWSRNWNVLKEVLCTDSSGEEECSLCTVQSDEFCKENLTGKLLNDLNESQAEAILTCLHKIRCQHKPVLELIWGPPGTGKTKATAIMLLNLLRMKCRTVICAPTNVAVIEIASRVVHLMRGDPLPQYNIYRRDELGKRKSLLEFLRERFLYIVKPLDGCLSTLWTQLCVSYVPKHIAYEIKKLLGHLESFSDLLSGKNLLFFSERLGEAFSCRSKDKCLSEPLPRPLSELYKKRFKCLTALKSVRHSLSGLGIPSFKVEDLEVADICLHNLVERITECTAPTTGWKYCISSAITFLSDALPQYNSHLIDELGKRKSLLECLRERFLYIVKPLERCLSTLCTQFCVSYDPKHIIDEITELLGHLESFSDLLSRTNFSQRLELAFSCQLKDKCLSEALTGPLSALYLKRSECLAALKSVRDSLNRLEIPSFKSVDEIKEFCFQSASLIFCTVSQTFKLHSLDKKLPQLLVIDEAAQMKECESVIPLQLLGLRHAILIGDERQLPAFVKSDVSKETCFGRSLFERLSSLGKLKHPLNVQYRMHPSISCFPNQTFYDGQIRDGPNVKHESYSKQYLPGLMFGSFSFINVSDGREELGVDGSSKRNPVEADVAAQILSNLYKGTSKLIILSLDSGEPKNSAGGSTVWEELLCDAIDRRCFFNADDDEGLAKTILEAKKKYNLLDDLLTSNNRLFRDAKWKVIFCENFRRSFRKLTSRRTRSSVMNLLRKLSSGWRPKWRDVDLICKRSSQIVKQFKAENLYILCTVDVEKESEYTQILKIWDVLPLEDTAKTMECLDAIYMRFSDEYVSRCKEKLFEGYVQYHL
ncbi:hypothetical protein CRG98_039041 [Punica granatum]|uniref:Helicase MAGATAMA 3 n=1 Tax=Punica granatum TaxID=22663 RepID=A0A2I0I998_PUNGR|nr:hypothetical protein CRG98_039041 [Punica granatum]